MKGIIVEIKGKKAIILNDDGIFESVANKSYSLGDEIEYAQTPIVFPVLRRYIPAVAAAAFMVLAGLGAYANFAPFSYVDVDINPSVELVSNMFDRVIAVNPLNDDAKAVVSELDLTAKPIEQAVAETVNKAQEKGYIKEDTADAVMISLSGGAPDRLKSIGEKAEKAVQSSTKSNKVNGLYVQTVAPEIREEAQKQNISPGKLLLIKRLKEVRPEADVQQVKNQPVAGIIKQIDTIREQKKDAPPQSSYAPLSNAFSERMHKRSDELKKRTDEAGSSIEKKQDTPSGQPKQSPRPRRPLRNQPTPTPAADETRQTPSAQNDTGNNQQQDIADDSQKSNKNVEQDDVKRKWSSSGRLRDDDLAIRYRENHKND